MFIIINACMVVSQIYKKYIGILLKTIDNSHKCLWLGIDFLYMPLWQIIFF